MDWTQEAKSNRFIELSKARAKIEMLVYLNSTARCKKKIGLSSSLTRQYLTCSLKAACVVRYDVLPNMPSGSCSLYRASRCRTKHAQSKQPVSGFTMQYQICPVEAACIGLHNAVPNWKQPIFGITMQYQTSFSKSTHKQSRQECDGECFRTDPHPLCRHWLGNIPYSRTVTRGQYKSSDEN
jgi:hypothetical protein